MYLPKNKKELKIIKTLIEYPKRRWTLTDISEESEIPKTTVWRSINRLEDKNFVEVSKKRNLNIIKVKNTDVFKRILELSSSDIKEMKKTAEEYADEIKKINGVKKCILFGSVARGTADFNSDIDILILVEEKNKEIEEKIRDTADKINSKKSLRIMPDIMKEKRFKKMKKKGEQFAEHIEKEGIVL